MYRFLEGTLTGAPNRSKTSKCASPPKWSRPSRTEALERTVPGRLRRVEKRKRESYTRHRFGTVEGFGFKCFPEIS